MKTITVRVLYCDVHMSFINIFAVPTQFASFDEDAKVYSNTGIVLTAFKHAL